MSTNTSKSNTNKAGLSLIRTKVVVGGNQSAGGVNQNPTGFVIGDGILLTDGILISD